MNLIKALIIRKAFVTSKLIEKYTPKIRSIKKNYNIVCPINSNHYRELKLSKLSQIDCLDVKFKVKSSTAKLIMKENAYQYNTSQFRKPNDVEWYDNFADERLFFGYGPNLFAQDEIQIAEHPSLESLREYLIAREREDKRFRPYTRDEHSKPTPVLIRGIERRLKISVEPKIEDGRPCSIYKEVISIERIKTC